MGSDCLITGDHLLNANKTSKGCGLRRCNSYNIVKNVFVNLLVADFISCTMLLSCIIAVQSLSNVWLCDPMNCSTPGFPSFTISWSLLRLMSIKSVMLSNHLILCCPCLLLPSIFPSIKVFSSESALHIRWPKYWSFNISPSNEYSVWFLLGLAGLICLLWEPMMRPWIQQLTRGLGTPL